VKSVTVWLFVAVLLAMAAPLGSIGVSAPFGLGPSQTLAQQALTEQERGWLARASRQDIAGWLHVRVQGAPFERGFQHGYLTAAEYAAAVRTYSAMTLHTTGMDYSFFVREAAALQKAKVPPELLEELEGLAAGFSKAGVPSTVDDVIGWNAWMEMTGYWWPTVATQYAASAPMGQAKAHCSGFIATGSATLDGQIVIGHTSFTEFWNGQYMNVILDITPDSGYRMVMQTSPGWVASMTDFWVTGAGLVVLETTLAGYQGYDVSKSPEWVRARTASQYARSLDEWVSLLDAQNNGGYANAWLIGDLNTNEIAKYEQGLVYQNLAKKSDGWYFGANVADDPRIRNLEISDSGYSDVRQQTGARRTRWPQVLQQYQGVIDAAVGQRLLADNFDVYLGRLEPSSRTISAHYDVDPMFYVSDPNAVWNVPFYPAGSVDAKVTTAAAARTMSMWGRFGRADGAPFDADEFLRVHPQWNWQDGYLLSRPHQPWEYFDGAAATPTR
jgi:hypothetical protein